VHIVNAPRTRYNGVVRHGAEMRIAIDSDPPRDRQSAVIRKTQDDEAGGA